MSEQFSQIRDQVVSTFTDTAGAAIAFAPKLIGAFLVLLAGWLLARLVQAIVQRSIRAGLEAILERTGVAQALERTSISLTPTVSPF